jgi:hypothetical protein
MTDFLESFTLQNTNSNPQLRDLTLLDLHQRPLRRTKHRSQNREPHTLSTNIFSLLSFAVTETLAQGRDLRIPRDLSSIVTKQGQGHTTPLHLLGSHLLQTLFAHSRSRQTLGLQRCDLSILPQSQKENNTATNVATTHLGSQQFRIVPVQLHRFECLQDGQTFRLLLVIGHPSSAQHLLRSLAFLSRDEMETGARGEERGDKLCFELPNRRLFRSPAAAR